MLLLSCLSNRISTFIYHNSLHKLSRLSPVFRTTSIMADLHKRDTLSDRLSKSVLPVHYNLKLQPIMETGMFKGNVGITVQVKEDMSYFNIHTKFLNIEYVKMFKKMHEIPIKNSTELKEIEQLHIQFCNKLDPGEYELEIEFNGDLTRNIVGFYLSHLENNRTMVASKFQPTYARQAFPCFDEPEYKATFNISLVKPTSYVALSNMNAISKTTDKKTDLETVQFETSVAMSTYLACFVICDFGFKETEINSNGIGKNFMLRSFAQKDELHKIDFAQDIGKRATEFYIKYYEVAFPLPKLDMIAIPDYVSGATEHWGLITYRETSFLVDESKASAKNKISVANTIAHELAHMWFGNLVTMKWWDEVWLNEGFASYMQVKSLNAIEPTWTMLDQFLTTTLHSALRTDAKLSSHAIVQTVSTPDQITAIFDAISYNKGSSILRMLEGFIGEENFRLGVSDYLKKFSFGNTVTQDLLTALEPYFKKDNPDLNISYIMDTWTKQMGYPILNVKPSSEPNTFVITQSRFLLDPDAVYENDSPFGYRWFIPITYKTAKGQRQSILWFPDTVNSVKLVLQESDTWFKINNNQVGYYRVNYPIEMWEKLIIQLKENRRQLSISDRSHLLNDAFALAEARFVPYSLMLDLSTYLTAEDDHVPWQTASSVFAELASRLINSLAYDSLQKYIQRLITPLYERQSWEKRDIPIIDNLLRTRILSLATRSQLPHAEAKVKELFFEWLNSQGTPNAKQIETDLRDFVYYYVIILYGMQWWGPAENQCYQVHYQAHRVGNLDAPDHDPGGMKSASQSDWERLWQIYLTEEDVQERAKLRNALSAPRDPSILRRYLTLAWNESNIRSQDYLSVVQQISSNPSGTSIVWDDVRTRWPQLVDRFTLNSRYLGGLVPSVTASFDTELKLKEMETFFSQYPDAGAGESARRRALETVRSNIRWSSAHLAAVSDWLAKTHAA